MELGLTQQAVARRFGCDTTTVHNWEINKTLPMLYLLPKVIEFLGYFPTLLSSQTLGQKIVTYRMLQGLSQKELASLLGIDPSTLGRIEHDKNQVNKRILKQLSTMSKFDT